MPKYIPTEVKRQIDQKYAELIALLAFHDMTLEFWEWEVAILKKDTSKIEYGGNAIVGKIFGGDDKIEWTYLDDDKVSGDAVDPLGIKFFTDKQGHYSRCKYCKNTGLEFRNKYVAYCPHCRAMFRYNEE